MLDGVFNNTHDCLVLVQYLIDPILLSNGEALAGGEGLVDEEGADVEGYAVCSNHVAILISQYKEAFVVDLKANFVNATIEEVHLVKLVQLFHKHDAPLLPPRLQAPQKTQHKVLVLLVVPGVEGRLVVARWVADTEEASEALEKFSVKIVAVDVDLRFFWQLVKESLLFFIFESKVLVHGPLVLEKFFDVPL